MFLLPLKALTFCFTIALVLQMIQNIAVICVMLLAWICIVSTQDSILLTMKPILPPYQGGPWVYPKPTTARPTIQQK